MIESSRNHREATSPSTTVSILALALVIVVFGVGIEGAPAIGSAACQPIGHFWHITDFHFDSNYTTTGDKTQMCWSNGTQEVDQANKPSGKYGDYRCDSPEALVDAALEGMNTIDSKPDFILWTGDDKAHVGDVNFSEDKVFEVVKFLTDKITNKFPGIPLVPVLGNHDWFPTHHLPGSSAVLYTRIGKLWENFLGAEGYERFSKGGFYTVKVNCARFVVLNTALYYSKNPLFADGKDKDPGGQFAWFEEEMDKAKQAGEKVYVTSHVPVGVFERHFKKGGWQWLQPQYNQLLVDLIIKHSDVISGQFFAHHHTDSFRVFQNSDGKPVSWMLIAPAITPWNTTLSQVGPNNPGLRRFTYDTNGQKILDWNQYYLNLTKANELNKVEWELEYNANETYNFGDDGVTPEALHRLANSWVTKPESETGEGQKLFDRYYYYNSVSYQSASECHDYCKHYHYCAITNLGYEAFETCRQKGDPTTSPQTGDNKAAARATDIVNVLAAALLVLVAGGAT